MPEAPRDRHCARSFSTVASTASMLGWDSGQLDGREVMGVLLSQPGYKLSVLYSTHLVIACPGSSSQTLRWLLPALSSVSSAFCLAGLLLRDDGSGDWEGPQL